MTVTPAFTRASTDDPLLTLNTADQAADPERFTWVWRPGAATSETTLSPAETWTRAGYYILADGPIDDQAAFLSTLDGLLPTIGTKDLRFLWVTRRDAAAPQDWRLLPLRATVSDGVGRLTDPLQVVLGGYSLMVAIGAHITVDDGGFTFSGGDIAPVFSFNGASRTVDGAVDLPLSGEAVGAFGFTVELSGASDFAALDLSVRYFTPRPAPAPPGGMLSLIFPVVEAPQGAFRFNGRLDPLATLQGDRSHLAFAPVSGRMPQLRTHLLTTLGYRVMATPVAQPAAPLKPARLCFARAPRRVKPSPSDPLYACPDGVFAIAPEPSSQGARTNAGFDLMPGLSGVENVTLPDSGALLSFTAGKPAFAPKLGREDEAGSLLPYTGDRPGLTDLAQTSWAYVVAPVDPVYHAQPDQSVLYTSPGTGDPHLSFQPVPAGSLPAPQTGADNDALDFPLLPFAALTSADIDTCVTLERTVVAPLRRARIAAVTQAPPPQAAAQTRAPEATGDVLCTTPAGVLVTLDSTLEQWKSVQFANSPAEAAPDGKARSLTFSDVHGGFRQALQTNRLFSVVADPDKLSACATIADPEANGELCIAGWTFKLAPTTWRSDTIMIVKFCDRSIADLVDDLPAWTWTDAAARGQGSAADTQARIKALLKAATDADEHVPTGGAAPYRAFMRDIIGDPGWNGVLFLNVAVPVDGLPEQLAGLAAGIDFSRFKAHHLALPITPVDAAKGRISTKPTVLAGLIDYQDAQDQFQQNTADYAFKVNSLQVLFANSDIANFMSTIQLMINKLFALPVLLAETERGNNIKLNGVYQRTESGDGYYDFAQEGSHRFALDSQILEEVETHRSHYASVSSGTRSGGADGGKVISRFEFWGLIRFWELAWFDAFSFGRAYNEETGEADFDGYLDFSSMAVVMSFDKDAPDDVDFTFDATKMSFDLTRSVARPQSLYRHFPLVFTGLADSSSAGADDSGDALTPGGLGYMECLTPIETGRPAAPWFGQTFELELGTLGSLAGNMGLKVGVICAWDGDDQVYVGLKLPGSTSGRREIPIEGLLKLGFGSVEFTADDDPERGRSYMLKLRQIALRLLLLSFPPGNLDLYLFGDPAARVGTASLGWYAGYSDEE